MKGNKSQTQKKNTKEGRGVIKLRGLPVPFVTSQIAHLPELRALAHTL